MTIQQSNIAKIVDYTAGIAGRIEGVKAVFGSGTGDVDDPLRAGQKIATAPSNPTAAYAHWSDVPNAPALAWESQSGIVELTWQVPMRLWLPKTDEEARRVALPFYDRYLRAFTRDSFLGAYPNNLALRSSLAHFRPGGDANWSWLDIGLMVVERVNYFVE